MLPSTSWLTLTETTSRTALHLQSRHRITCKSSKRECGARRHAAARARICYEKPRTALPSPALLVCTFTSCARRYLPLSSVSATPSLLSLAISIPFFARLVFSVHMLGQAPGRVLYSQYPLADIQAMNNLLASTFCDLD